MTDADSPAPGRWYFEDFLPGEKHVTSTWEATADEITSFAAKYDAQYFHLDAERARASAFGGLVGAGFQTAAVAWKLALATGKFDHCPVAGIGIDALRWLAPVRVGDVIHAEFALVEGVPSKSRPGVVRVAFDYTMVNQRGEPVMTFRLLQLLKRRPASDDDGR